MSYLYADGNDFLATDVYVKHMWQVTNTWWNVHTLPYLWN